MRKPTIRSRRTSSRKTEASVPPHADLTITAFQDFIRRRYYRTDRARGTPGTFLWFAEEVGELASALAHKARGQPPSNLEEEFADVLAWLCTLANINDVDLAQAVWKKYLTGGGPRGHK